MWLSIEEMYIIYYITVSSVWFSTMAAIDL
jgi:hypothetical protein